MLYAIKGSKYSASVPTASKKGTYVISYYCTTDNPNYKDSDVGEVTAYIRNKAKGADDSDEDDMTVFGVAEGAAPGIDGDLNNDLIDDNVDLDNNDPMVGDSNDDLLPNSDSNNVQNLEDNYYVEPEDGYVGQEENAQPQSGLMMAQNVIMQVVPTVYDHDIFRIGANIQSIDILDQRDNFGNAVTFFSEDGKQIIRSPLAPAGTYIIEAKVKIAWIVDENGQAQAIILDSDIEKPVEEAIGADDNYAYQYYQQAVAEAQQNYDYDDDDDNDQTPQIVTPEVTAPQDNSSLDVEEFLKEEEDSDPNSEVFYENKQDESDEQPAEGAEQ